MEIANWDTFLYSTIEKILNYMALVGEINVTIKYARKFLLSYKDVFGWTMLLGHGHRIMGRGALSSIHKTNDFIARRIVLGYYHDVYMMGHVHHTRFWSTSHNKYYIANKDSDQFSLFSQANSSLFVLLRLKIIQ